MFPDPSVLSLVGWSNQFVNESLWDIEDDVDVPVAKKHQNTTYIAATKLGSNKDSTVCASSNECLETSWKHFSQLNHDSFRASSSVSMGSHDIIKKATFLRNEQRAKTITRNLIDEVLRDLDEVIDLADVLGSSASQGGSIQPRITHHGTSFPEIVPVTSHRSSELPVPSLTKSIARRLSITDGASYKITTNSSSPLTPSSMPQYGSAVGSSTPSHHHVPSHTRLRPRSLEQSSPRPCGILVPAPNKKQRFSGPPLSQDDCKSSSAELQVVHGSIDDSSETRFREYQNKQWDEAFEELLEFKRDRGSCQVPHGFKDNPPLSRWVKRQRYQYKLIKEEKASTMNDERIQRLEAVGFVWDSHNSTWECRIAELHEYQRLNGHVSVPTSYRGNMKLATWVKQQRRQYKLFCQGRPSNITLERIEQLQSLGFEWSIRVRGENNS